MGASLGGQVTHRHGDGWKTAGAESPSWGNSDFRTPALSPLSGNTTLISHSLTLSRSSPWETLSRLGKKTLSSGPQSPMNSEVQWGWVRDEGGQRGPSGKEDRC